VPPTPDSSRLPPAEPLGSPGAPSTVPLARTGGSAAATNALLVATLVITIGAVVEYLRRTGADEVDPDVAGAFLALFTGLFALRVVGQLVVLIAAPAWLPPMDRWNLMPYRLLLPIQLLFLAVMSWIWIGLLADEGGVAEPHRRFGLTAIGLSLVYAGSMVIRYVVRMRRRPGERWFGGAIPIVFHIVLAAFVFIYGLFNASY
jgi:hypothetical protein